MVRVAQPDQIDIIVADLDRYSEGEIRVLASNMNANLRENPPVGTPVDTGWARANWMPSLNEPADADVSIKKPTAADVAFRAAESEAGLNEVLAWTINDGPIFSTNNVPYIVPLNEGHSAQSPPGFVQAALELAVRQTKSVGANWASFNRRADAFRAAKPKPVRTRGKPR